MYKVVTLLAISVIISLAQESSYDIKLMSFEILPPEGGDTHIIPRTLRMTQKGRNQFTLMGSVEVNHRFGPRDMIKIEYRKKIGNEQYFPLGAIFKNACELSKQPFYQTLTKASNFPNPPECPFPKGNYTINDLQLDESFYPSVLPTGLNFIQIHFLVENKITFGVRVYSDVKKIK